MALRLVLAFAVSLWVGCSLCREREGMCGPQGLEGVLAEGHCEDWIGMPWNILGRLGAHRPSVCPLVGENYYPIA